MTVTSKHKTIIDGIVGQLITLGLDGISNSNVKACWWPAAEQLKNTSVLANLPCVLVSPYATEEMSGGTNIQDDYGYPCLVSILAPTDQNLVAGMDKYMGWRESIIKAFHNKTGAAVGAPSSTIYRTIVRPGNIADFASFQAAAIWASYLTIIATDRSTRV